ncbi:hypothetical protein A1Q1_00278 [Trichosporon asahii var. asahii CBS 2479]|uniref:Uncharacterized protein n=1 Tax=Trichosporon asahii var. asahii (strain ATCC 90039 / CBS 2479 / JCM 2466 / KCTC 7840 / NBRC 103889/ NCYC 2677 / UAMH 7654) TaxID=1186058 RepID=J6F0H0_TRIAS|nr:hypothetical protein A1Q1_00278 [Trichosporon asahii var. asahii CBS 2479]EJT50434.1 hypothetical protein A1Q1_00278 [Trichosporon asahii var. asahii CBS 2479]
MPIPPIRQSSIRAKPSSQPWPATDANTGPVLIAQIVGAWDAWAGLASSAKSECVATAAKAAAQRAQRAARVATQLL